jgi:hypothetical protein
MTMPRAHPNRSASRGSFHHNAMTKLQTATARLKPIPNGNAAKYFSYAEAWGRIKKSIGCEFYLEAVTIEESIMCDRLISYLCRIGALKPDANSERQSFASLIACWKKHVPAPIGDHVFSDLQHEVDTWRKRRNKVVHGMVKSVPGAKHQDILDFKKEAELVALLGQRVAKSLCNWYDREKYRLAKLTAQCNPN